MENNNTQQRPPSLVGIQMKRLQSDTQEKNIIALLDKRRELANAQYQNDADLEFIGYHPPMKAPQEPKFTDSEWQSRVSISNKMLIERSSFINPKEHQQLGKERDTCAQLLSDANKEIRNLKKLLKGVKITGAKKK